MPGTSTSHFDWLLRFRRLDDALALADGLNLSAFGGSEGVNQKSVWRDLDAINAAGITKNHRRDKETSRYTHHSTCPFLAE